MNTPDFLADFISVFNSLYAETTDRVPMQHTMTLGVVVSTDDPLEQGRLQVFCPGFGDDPDKITAIPWSVYVTPFGGVIDNSSYVRGPDGKTTNGPVHYGFWGIPEMGAYVLVGCMDGDYRRRFWIGSIVSHQETSSLIKGKHRWQGGSADGPLSSDGNPLEPQYSNLSKAFDDDRQSSEWKSRGADYQVSNNRKEEASQPNSVKGPSYMDSDFSDVVDNELLDEAKPALGENGYDWTNFGNIHGHKSSKVYGYSTPGGHTIHCDDRTYNSRIKIRSSAGHTVLLDDTNERIYVMTAEGNSYVELDSNGNVDVYAKRRLSVHAEKDINFSTDETFRVHAKKGIHLYSGNTLGQEELDRVPNDGEIRIHSTDDFHLISEKNIRVLSIEDTLLEVGGKVCQTVAENWSLQVQDDINIVSNTSDYKLTVLGNINELAGGNIRRYALGETSNLSNGNSQFHSFAGKVDIGAMQTMNIKSIGSDVMLESVGRNNGGNASSLNGGSGGVYMKTPNSIIAADDKGVTTITTGFVMTKTPLNVQAEIAPVDLSVPPKPDVPEPDCESASEPGMLDLEGFSGPELAARAAYNAGFRGQDLVTAVAIAGAESGFNPDATNNADGRPQKWGASVGMWQVRTLQQPQEWGGIDAQRDINTQRGVSNVQNNANFARSLFDRSGFREWSVYNNGNGPYKNFLGQAQAAVNSLCGGGIITLTEEEKQFSQIFSSFDFSSGCAASMVTNGCNPDLSLSLNSSFSLGVEGMNIQSQIDTIMKSVQLNFSTTVHENIIGKISEVTDKLNKLTFSFASYVNVIGQVTAFIGLAQAAVQFFEKFDIPVWEDFLQLQIPFFPDLEITDILSDIGFEQLLPDICKFDIPNFDAEFEAVYSLSMSDLCEGVDISSSLKTHFNPPIR